MSTALEVQISTDTSKMQLDKVFQYLSQEAYWSKGLPREVFDRSVENSICFGAYLPNGDQVAFARVITDKATFAYLADVFVAESQRGQGLSKHLIQEILSHSDLQGLRRFSLATADAHELYKKFGFTPLSVPEIMMERLNRSIYETAL
ncbi:Acetyltransferase (GNAT) family protein [Pseudovibrio axinellae]|uniref:Acetyltransferase (GNAT) family protein n=1 Tax=Pseudovibrio axinellae TaxID=989403 RepID=A0A166AQP3_9HYPH|nr:GNAT family N-acetyltransferase [Pseudovibrio axinellae]KZL21432.1 Acetyltransferase (GNAT) family protein [Pseudovibrio axinellae]SER00128.1 Acetyltransferase (GNAT) family protein [Pseudovibrio axinellae]